MQNMNLDVNQDMLYRKQPSTLSVIPEGNGSNSQFVQIREPTQEFIPKNYTQLAWNGEYTTAANGSSRQLAQEEDRDNTQEFTNSDIDESVQGHRTVAREKNTSLPEFGRLREKYTDPNRFLKTPDTSPNSILIRNRPDPIGVRCYSDNNLMKNRRFQA